MRCPINIRLRKSETGQSIVEGTLCLLFLCLLIFGLLQIFYISVAQLFTDYSGFFAARSATVGFAPYIVTRTARASAVAASGTPPSPGVSGRTPSSGEGGEYLWIKDYQAGRRGLSYPYWDGSTNLSNSANTQGDVATSYVQFNNYPLDFPMRSAFTSSDSIDIHSTANLINHSAVYLE